MSFFLGILRGIKYGINIQYERMELYITDNRDGSWGWNSVWARDRKSAINKANKKLKTFSGDYTLNVESLNTNEDTYNQLMGMYW